MNTSLHGGAHRIKTATPLAQYYADLHIHIGSAMGKAVKITASRNLQLKTIIYGDAPRKGLDIVGIVDAGSTLVIKELKQMLAEGDLAESPQGGCLAGNGILVVLASEIESREGVHLVSYLPDLCSLEAWQGYFRNRVRNQQLSTQRAAAGVQEIIDLTRALGGIFCPAHVFTPHKGIYGAWTDRLTNKLEAPNQQFKALELGLSADTEMAGRLAETADYVFLSNSDAHSSANIGREFNLLQLGGLNFEELRRCIENLDGRCILANYGLHPRLGKYHRSFCPECSTITTDDPPVTQCARCGNERVIMGVYDRIVAIQDHAQAQAPPDRPPYHYRVPLKDLPGIGVKTCHRLLQVFKNELELLEKAPLEAIRREAGAKVADAIGKMRSGDLSIIPGGGGRYGRVQLG